MDKGTLNFDIKTGMKNIIGRDLIIDDFIAIYELVKNSYDAYASYVKLTFTDNEIIISDNGKGMSKTDLAEKWFAVAYSAKKDGSEDENTRRESVHLNNLKSRRYYAGAKGVGRFSCDRLGNKLELKTSNYKDSNAYLLNIDWTLFEKNAKQSFDSIEIPFVEIQKSNDFPQDKDHGTILKISSLNSKWTRARLVDLKRSLEKLINPFSDNINFRIEIEADEFKSSDEEYRLQNNISQIVNGPIANSILKVLDLKTTQIDVVIKDDLITTKIIDRGSLIYHIEEKNDDVLLIDDMTINLYYLNRSAKINFLKLMDIESKNYGSIFLFKNGFRVQPYGETGDDSWKIDNRKQQGFNRFLGTRDLFGKVEIVTENIAEFKESSSRDGGLVDTLGKVKIFGLFDKSFKRLERYVVGVLWGEAFLRKKYFFNDHIATTFRDRLGNDKDKESYEDILNNVGSKIDFVNLIKTLSDDDGVKILYCNRDLLNLVNDKLDEVQPKFIADLEKIADKTDDDELINQIKITEENFNKLLKEKEDAQKREELERNRRIQAEKKAEEERLLRIEEERKRIEAENRRKEAEEKRRQAEIESLRKDKEKAEAELARIKAEKRAEEEAERSKALDEKLTIESKKNLYLNATRKTLSDEADQLVHSINLYVGNASGDLNTILVSKDIKDEVREQLYLIKENIDRAIKVSQSIIKSSFDYRTKGKRLNLATYIKEYLNDVSISRKKLDIQIDGLVDKYFFVSPLEIDIILDNFISNSVKAGAKKILVEFSLNDNSKLEMYYYDDGLGVADILVNNPESIFELGVRASTEIGSGIGMYDAQKRMKRMGGIISFIGNNKKLKGAGFKFMI